VSENDIYDCEDVKTNLDGSVQAHRESRIPGRDFTGPSYRITCITPRRDIPYGETHSVSSRNESEVHVPAA
jgi:hypothetical protein